MAAAVAEQQRAWCHWEADNKSTPGSGTAVNLPLETLVSYTV